MTEVCARAGLESIDTRELYGIIRGYAPGDVDDARALLQPLMVAFGFDAAEREGRIVFRSRGITRTEALDPERVVASEDAGGDIVVTRVAPEETAARVLLSFVNAEGDFDVRSTGAGAPAVTGRTVTRSELPLALTPDEAAEIAERWVAETRIARDRLRLSLSAGGVPVGAGDVIRVPGAGTFRIDAVEDTGVRAIDAIRVEQGIYRPAEYPAEQVRLAQVLPPLPVEAEFLDLPLLRGDEDAVAPYVAATADPWAPVAVYSSADGESYTLDAVVERASIMGETETALPAALPGAWDRGPPLRIRLFGGALSSATELAVLNGANAMAIGSGDGDWEVFQFATAELVAPGVWAVSRLLRGQAGTEALIPAVWPPGSRVVLLDEGPVQLAQSSSMIGIERAYRYGPARRPPDDPSYREADQVFRAAGLLPYAPVHLKAIRRGADIELSWIRRTRIDGDRWDSLDVPLGELAERYLLRVVAGGVVRREAEVSVPFWTYAAAMRGGDAVTGGYAVEICQISDRVGPGRFARIEINE